MKKKLIALLITATMALSLTACGGSGDDKKEDTKTVETSKEDTKEESKEDEATYESILADYTAKLQDATPGLVDEFNSEAAEKAGDINALAELSNSKTEELAKISNEGVEKMAQLKLANGDDDQTYNDWAQKLMDVYEEQATQITDAYTSAATGQ